MGRTARVTGRGRGAAGGLIGAAVAAVAIACVPARGGWDAAALARAEPSLASIRGQRLADMLPYPALAMPPAGPSGDAARGGEPSRVALVACRFAPGAVLRVRAGGAGWSAAPGEAALAAFSRQAGSLGLAFERATAAGAEVEIAIEAVPAEGADAPVGLGDTLVECDVGTEGPDGDRPRGVVVGAQIRMRRSGVDAAGRVVRADDATWIGALLHELAHALGFSGHAATGDSLLVRDESRLRRFGRAAAGGEAIDDPTLEALYRLAPGRALGERSLSPAGAAWVGRILALDARRAAAGDPRRSTRASVGDREACIVLRYAAAAPLVIRFPGWAERLRKGGPVLAWPDPATQAALRAAGLGL